MKQIIKCDEKYCKGCGKYYKSNLDVRQHFTFEDGKGNMWMDNPKAGSTTIRNMIKFKCIKKIDTEFLSNIKFSFAFVRNPYDKMVSNYKMFTSQLTGINQLRDMSTKDYTIDDIKNFSFLEFCELTLNHKNHHWCNQHNFMIKYPDFLGRFETFYKDLCSVMEMLKISVGNIPHINKTQHKHYTDYYDDTTRKLVTTRYAKDIEYFNYKFGE